MNELNDNLAENNNSESNFAIVKTEEEWRKILTDEQYHIAREGGTERAFTGIYNNNHEQGIYACVACGTKLFKSDEKFDSGSGWPSFWQPILNDKGESNVGERDDFSFGMHRTEVFCKVCGSHLGHLFNDGPTPTGLRYCINSASLNFKNKSESQTGDEPEIGDVIRC